MKETTEILQEISDYCLEMVRRNHKHSVTSGLVKKYKKYYQGKKVAYGDIICKLNELANKLDK